MSYTPGPWFVNTGEYDATADEWTERPDVFSTAPDVMGNLICEAPTDFLLSMASWKENARLIAAAPALLAACEELLKHPEGDDGPGGDLSHLNRAIELATKAVRLAKTSDPQPKGEA